MRRNKLIAVVIAVLLALGAACAMTAGTGAPASASHAVPATFFHG